MNIKFAEESFEKLKVYCEKEGFKGWDPYDGLNSKIFQSTFLKNHRIARLIWIQLFKKSPINLRPIFLVKKDYNPKGLGLFINGYCNLFKRTNDEFYLNKIHELSNILLKLVSKGYSGCCWGYNFDWQARAFYQPRYTPTIVATSFIGYALLDAYDLTKNEEFLYAARSSCDFILYDLNRTYDSNSNFAFSYSPLDQTQVFNASLLGCKLLSRVFSYTAEKHLIEESKNSIKFCIDHQQENGAWPYGTLPFHQWVDNFHTGYNLECIHEYQRYSKDISFQKNLEKGLAYYLNTFFTIDGKSKYYNNQLFPIDIHSSAQLIVTLFRLNKIRKNRSLIERVLVWTIKNMQNSKGHFYYQKRKLFSSRISYIRWAQAWMFYGLSFYLLHETNQTK